MKISTRKIIYVCCIFTIVGAVCLAYSYFIEPHSLVVNHHEISISGLNPAFDGLRIVAVSDIHGGSHGVPVEKLQQIVELVNEQNADIVTLLGDYVSHDPATGNALMPARIIADNLRGIKSKYGAFAVLGNHDGWVGSESVAVELRNSDIRVIENEVVELEINGSKLRIYGTEDHLNIESWREFYDNSRRILSSTDQTSDMLLLQHSSDILAVIADDPTATPNLKLVLAGHTHGGQIRLPIFGAPIVPSSYGQKYAAGHVVEKGIDMFVTTGVGTSILPFRFMVPPEIAVLTLRSE